MKLVTLESLRNDALLRADAVKANPHSVAEVNGYVNKGYSKFYDELIKANADYNVGQQLITTGLITDPAAVLVNGVQQMDTYKLASDFYRHRGHDISYGAQTADTSKRVMWADRNQYKYWGTVGWFYGGEKILYYLRDNFQIFVPIPQGPFAVTAWYYPVAKTLNGDSDSIDVLSGGDDFIATYAAMCMARAKERWGLYNALKQDFGDEMQRISCMAPDRDANEPPRVQETCRRRYGGWSGGGYR